ncbi:MAG: hypothetical protein ACOCVX_01525 [Bacteroidales bacterium]
MHKLTNILLSFAICFFSFTAMAQWDEKIFHTEDSIYDAGISLVRVDNFNHFYNLEYYNPMAYSYTLAGYHIKPEFIYHISKAIRVSGGVYFHQMLGKDELQFLRPVYTFDYHPFVPLTLKFGTLKGGLNHKLPEQIYSYQQALEQYNEEGIQIIFENKKLFADVWVDWRYLSFPNDNQPERIFGGYNITYKYRLTEKSQAGVTTQMSAWHIGGQNLDIERKMQTILNFTGGLMYSYDFQNTLSLGIREQFMHFENVIDQDILPYKRGFGFATEALLSWKFISLSTGYWYANHFYAPLGNHLFSCISKKSAHIMHPQRHVIYAHIKAEKEMSSGVFLGFRSGIYEGVDLHSSDFYLALLMRFTHNFLISHKKQRP